MIYVDPLMNHGWRMYGKTVASCHLLTDSEDFEELHRFAEKIGLKRAWFHKDHYDLTESRRRAAVFAGAIELSLRDPRLASILLSRRNHKRGAQ